MNNHADIIAAVRRLTHSRERTLAAANVARALFADPALQTAPGVTTTEGESA